MRLTTTVLGIIFMFSTNVFANEIGLKTFNFTQNNTKSTSLLRGLKATNFNTIDEIKRSSGRSVYQSVLPSVVKVLTNDGHGTGIVISPNNNGMIITNDHVTKGYETVGVVFANDKNSDEVSIGTVVKFDEISDLALIILNKKRNDIVPIAIAENRIEVGDDVHAIGHPIGEDWTYTRGYVSQKRESYTWQTDATSHHSADVIQTQTPINPGNSGGPLVNNEGELIGINSFGASEYQGINFSIALSTFYKFLASDNSVERKVMDGSKFGNLLNSFDENKNGLPDVYLFDSNNNNELDLIAHDEDENLYAEQVAIDENENGIFELLMYEMELDGQSVIVYEFDEDEDETREAIGIDFDRDGKVDQVIPADKLQG
jgi:S1-C subfamily serine protease